MQNAIAFADNDVIVVAWSYGHKLPTCMGFSVHRIDSTGKETPLPSMAGHRRRLAAQRPGRRHDRRAHRLHGRLEQERQPLLRALRARRQAAHRRTEGAQAPAARGAVQPAGRRRDEPGTRARRHSARGRAAIGRQRGVAPGLEGRRRPGHRPHVARQPDRPQQVRRAGQGWQGRRGAVRIDQLDTDGPVHADQQHRHLARRARAARRTRRVRPTWANWPR